LVNGEREREREREKSEESGKRRKISTRSVLNEMEE